MKLTTETQRRGEAYQNQQRWFVTFGFLCGSVSPW